MPRGPVIRTPVKGELGPSTGQVVGLLALGAFPAIAMAIVMVKGGGTSNPFVFPLAAVTLLINAGIVSMDIRYGLAMFIVAAGLSPKLPGVYDNLRVEDFIFLFVFLIWWSRQMRKGKLPPVNSPFVKPFVVLTVFSVVATFFGVVVGMIPDAKYSFFLQAKRIEYFLIFYVVSTTIKTDGWLRMLTGLFVASGALAAIYGLANPTSAHDQSVMAVRVSGPEGENYNTLAGYLVICIAVGIGAIPAYPRGRTKFFLILCTMTAAAAVLMSFSREGYVMLVGTLTVFGFTRHRKLVLSAFLALIVIFFAAEPVRNNVHNTVGQIQNSREADPGQNSLTARFYAWEYRMNGWFWKWPLFGCGVGSVALSVDSEYVLRLCEVGVVGFGIFLWWLVSIGQEVRRLQRTRGFPQMISIGLGAAFVGLLIQASVAASFNSIRTMEPFWYLLGLVSAAVMIQRNKAAQEARLCAS